MNKTEYSLDSCINEIQNNNDQQYPCKYILTVNPTEITPSFMFDQNSTFSIALRFSTSKTESKWSNTIKYNLYTTDKDEVENGQKTENNKKCVIIRSE